MGQRAGNGHHNTFRAARARHGVAWVLIAGFLLQPILAYLVTPFVGHDSGGRTVVVCTLKGERLTKVELPSIDGAIEPLAVEHCSALKLFQMAGTASLAAMPVVPPVILHAVAVVDQTADQPRRSLHFSAYSTRAPPRLS